MHHCGQPPKHIIIAFAPVLTASSHCLAAAASASAQLLLLLQLHSQAQAAARPEQAAARLHTGRQRGLRDLRGVTHSQSERDRERERERERATAFLLAACRVGGGFD